MQEVCPGELSSAGDGCEHQDDNGKQQVEVNQNSFRPRAILRTPRFLFL